MFLTQGLHHVCDLIEHYWKGSMTGMFLKVSMEYIRLEIGINSNLFKTSYYEYNQLVMTTTWMTHTLQFMTDHNITCDIKVPEIPLLQEGDTTIMEKVLGNRAYTGRDLKAINACRIYLQVFLLSLVTENVIQKVAI